MIGRFSFPLFDIKQLKYDIRHDKEYRLNCRRSVNRLIRGGGDPVEVFAKNVIVYNFALKFSGINYMLKFPFDICKDSVQKIYHEIKIEAEKSEKKTDHTPHEQALIHANNSLKDQNVRKMFCSKMMSMINKKRVENNFKTEEQIGRFTKVYNYDESQNCTRNNCNFVQDS